VTTFVACAACGNPWPCSLAKREPDTHNPSRSATGDPVEIAATALREANGGFPAPLRVGTWEGFARTVLDAVSFDALKAENEGLEREREEWRQIAIDARMAMVSDAHKVIAENLGDRVEFGVGALEAASAACGEAATRTERAESSLLLLLGGWWSNWPQHWRRCAFTTTRATHTTRATCGQSRRLGRLLPRHATKGTPMVDCPTCGDRLDCAICGSRYEGPSRAELDRLGGERDEAREALRGLADAAGSVLAVDAIAVIEIGPSLDRLSVALDAALDVVGEDALGRTGDDPNLISDLPSRRRNGGPCR
jgi:hypothetical protein